MESILNTDLFLVGIAVAGAGTLGFSIYFSNTKSATAQAFLFFALMSIFWSVTNFASARVTNPTATLWLIRLVLFFATWHAFSFFILARQFPSVDFTLSKKVFLGLLSWSATVSIVTLTPVVYESITAIVPVVETKTGPGIALFGLTVFSLIGLGFWSLGRKFFRSSGIERHQLQVVLIGMMTTFAFLIVFDFIFPAFLNNPTLVPYGGLFLLPFIVGTAYAILRDHLFNIKVITTASLVLVLSVVLFIQIVVSSDLISVIFHTTIFALMLVFGINLIKSVVREVEQREKIEKIANELKIANEMQADTTSLITHQIRGVFTNTKSGLSNIIEGSYGPVPPELMTVMDAMFKSQVVGVKTVETFLQAQKVESGTIQYDKKPFDLKAVVEQVSTEEKSNADSKGLHYEVQIEAGEYTLSGDQVYLTQVIANLIDNAIRYTEKGSILVQLSKKTDSILYSVKDSGIGIPDDDKEKMFTKYGHGKDSRKTNAASSGLGLYIVKGIVVGHGGKIWYETEVGRGTTFFVELPITQAASPKP